MTEPLVYLNGKMLPASGARLAIHDAGVVMGATVTEMTRTFRLRPYRLGDHLERLYRSLEYTHMRIDLSFDQIRDISLELIEHNGRLIDEAGELCLVHFVTAGELPAYAGMIGGTSPIEPTVCVHTFPLPFERWAKQMRSGQHLVIPSVRHVPPECLDPGMKCRSRMHFYLADQQAKLVDPEAVALLLDLAGNVTETSGANFLIVRDEEIVSPRLKNTLPGISRQTIIELAAKLDIGFAERDIGVEEVIGADEALTVSTSYCLLPVTRVNGSPIGDGTPGPIFRRLLQSWSEVVGLDIEQQVIEGAARRVVRNSIEKPKFSVSSS